MRKHRILFGVVACVLMIAIGISLIYLNRIVDDIDIEFVNDDRVHGTWEVVDFVSEIEDFSVDDSYDVEGSFLKNVQFLDNGRLKMNDDTDRPWFAWSKGYITHSGDKTASAYVVKNIDGVSYLFFEWKSGDYIYFHREPEYYVLRKSS